MRPVKRGDCPNDANNNPIVYTKFEQARGALIKRMGEYCSYCNQKLPASLAVEHVQPKSVVPELELEWDNFLLGCTNCNSTKGSKPIILNEYVWPDQHNTHLALQYNDDGTIDIHPLITDETLKKKIQNMLDLVGLQKYVNIDNEASDRRWINRKIAIKKAKSTLELYEQIKEKDADDEAIKLISILVPDSGFFSVWMNVFEKYPEVRKKLIASFPGTAKDAFHADTTQSIRRTEIM